jgi:cell filamentation protein, protein adenylyltransferase
LTERKGRYDTSGNVQDQYEPGSDGLVLKNLRGISDKYTIDEIEAELLYEAHEKLVVTFDESHQFTCDDICLIHRTWLESLYSWAGKYRTVNIGKEGFQFANAMYIDNLMVEFDKDVLEKHTPCKRGPKIDVAESIAIVHAELILIHPFREGNGRTARLLAYLMAFQTGREEVSFAGLNVAEDENYVLAIHSAMERNYDPMIRLFCELL